MAYVENLVSIVTPVYNGELHIERYLEAILSQTYDRVQLILVDDGSKDNTVSVAEKYKDRFKAKGYAYTIVKEEHSSAAGAISAGLKYVEGEFLIWPDSDDVILPESIEKRVTFLKENPQYNAVRSIMKYVNETDGSECSADESLGDLKNTKLFWDILYSKTFVCCGCYMLKSEAFFAIYPDKKIPVYNVGQNFQMLLPFMFNNECATLNEILYVVYKRSASHSRRVLTREQEEIKYADYERMIDELASIAGITSAEDLNRILHWKLNRRVSLANKHGDIRALSNAYTEMRKAGLITIASYFRKQASVIKRIIKLAI